MSLGSIGANMSADPPSDKSGDQITIQIEETDPKPRRHTVKVFQYDKSDQTSNSEYIETNKEHQIMFDEFEMLLVSVRTQTKADATTKTANDDKNEQP